MGPGLYSPGYKLEKRVLFDHAKRFNGAGLIQPGIHGSIDCIGFILGASMGPGLYSPGYNSSDQFSVSLIISLQWGRAYTARDTWAYADDYYLFPKLQWGRAYTARDTTPYAPLRTWLCPCFNGAGLIQPGIRTELTQI